MADSPIGQYEPEALVLAPEDGGDPNTLSLVSQLRDLGVAVELDENWQLPTEPPRDLSCYKVCMFPDTARERYDAELDAFHRAGGYLGYFKYYPTSTGVMDGVHHFLQGYGRDAYFYHLANVVLEGGLTVRHPDFIRALESRSTASVHAELRSAFVRRYGSRTIDVWRAWGDPQYTMLYAHLTMADATQDEELLDLVRYCLGKLVESKDEPLSRRAGENQLPETVDTNMVLYGALLMHMGDRYEDATMTEAGLALGRLWTDHADDRNGILYARYMRYLWGESFAPVPCLYWMSRVTGDQRFADYADRSVETITRRNLQSDGIWDHWSDDGEGRGASWSRGNGWAVLWLTMSLCALDPDTARAARIRDILRRAFAGLTKHQDPESGLWHLVVDEPETRLETTGTAGFVDAHDRLRQMDVFGDEYAPMIERAFTGLKRMHYRDGLANACRGTATGVPDYYRTRPLGHFRCSLFPGSVGRRANR